MLRLRLRKIIPTKFNRSDERKFDEAFFAEEHRELLKSLKKDDTVCFIALGEHEMCFSKGYAEGRTEEGNLPCMLLFTAHIRIKRGPGLSNKFEPKMLANYARMVGIELIGLPLFEQYYKHLK